MPNNVFEDGLKVERYDVNILHVATKVTGGGKIGQSFLAMTMDIAPEVGIKWFGPTEAWEILRRYLRKFSKEASFQALDAETGFFDTQKFLSIMQSLSAVGETVGSLKERRDDLVVEATTLWGRLDGIEGAERVLRMAEIGEKMKMISTLQQAIATKKKTVKEEAEAALPDATPQLV